MPILCFKMDAISRRPSARVRNAQGAIEYQSRVVPEEARSVAGAIAYQSRAALTDPGSGKRLSYFEEHDCALSEVLLAAGAPLEWLDAQRFVDALEAAEEREDARTAVSLIVSIPRGLTAGQELKFARKYLRESFVDRGLCVAWALHRATAIDGLPQPHIHAVIATRAVRAVDSTEPTGFAATKFADLYARSAVKKLRWAAAQAMNEALADAGLPDRVDPRKLSDQADALESGIEEAGASLTDAEREHLEAHLALLRRPAEIPTSVSGKRKEWAEAKAILAANPENIRYVDPDVREILEARKARKNFETSVAAVRDAAVQAGRDQTYTWLTDRFKRVQAQETQPDFVPVSRPDFIKQPIKPRKSFTFVKDFDARDAAERRREREFIRLQRSLKKALEAGEELAKFFAMIFLGKDLVDLATRPNKTRRLDRKKFEKLPVKEQARVLGILVAAHRSRSVESEKESKPYVWSAHKNLEEIPASKNPKKRRRRMTKAEKESQRIAVELAVRRRRHKSLIKIPAPVAPLVAPVTLPPGIVRRQESEKRSALRLR